ncbi:hypothetical protein Tco_1274435 [Tanacetum coccineum]
MITRAIDGQFCDSDLEVAFRKHTCCVRDINGADILKGSRGITNLYTIIAFDEMMKSFSNMHVCSVRSSSGNVNSAEPNQVNYPPDHLRRWTKDHPLDNIVGNPSRPLKDYGFDFNKIPLYCDNKSAIALYCNKRTINSGSNTSTYCTISYQRASENRVLNLLSGNELSTCRHSLNQSIPRGTFEILFPMPMHEEFEPLKTLRTLQKDRMSKQNDFNTMQELNDPDSTTTRTKSRLYLLSLKELIIGKSNLLFNAQKIQKNPIFQISASCIGENLLWIQYNFSLTKQVHKASLKDPKKKQLLSSSLIGRFIQVINLLRWANQEQHPTTPDSVVHHTGDDFILGNLKFVPKGRTVEVFGMDNSYPLN